MKCECLTIACEAIHVVDDKVYYMSDGFTRGFCEHCDTFRHDLLESWS